MKKLILSAMALLLAVSTTMAQSEEVRTKYNEAVEAFGAKDFAKAANAFIEVIDKGIDDTDAASLVATAKGNLPTCYYQLSVANAKATNYDVALEYATKSANYAELYDDVTAMNKANNVAGAIYKSQGKTPFNDKNYAEAAAIFEKGIALNPRNTEMTNWLAICYCEMGDLDKGMAIFSKVVEMGATNPTRYGADATTASNNIALYINNQVAKLQASKDYDGVIAMADGLLATNPANATAAFVRLQAYMDKKDLAKVIEIGESTADVQTTEEGKSNVYFVLAAAYNAKQMKPQAIAALKKVTAGANAAAAAATAAELSAAE